MVVRPTDGLGNRSGRDDTTAVAVDSRATGRKSTLRRLVKGVAAKDFGT